MRELTSHQIAALSELHREDDLDEFLRIEVVDGPGPGGACHLYSISVGGPRRLSHVEHQFVDHHGLRIEEPKRVLIEFQKGPVREVGVNGLSDLSLLAIVEDRLKGFQFGPCSCRENAIALTKLQEAMMWLQRRTLDRLARGVEGTSVR